MYYWQEKIKMLDNPKKQQKEFAEQERFKKISEKWDKHDTKVCNDLEKAYKRKDKREIGGWLKAWAKDDKKDLRRWEKEMARD